MSENRITTCPTCGTSYQSIRIVNQQLRNQFAKELEYLKDPDIRATYYNNGIDACISHIKKQLERSGLFDNLE